MSEAVLTDEEFLRQFESCTLPFEAWHHRQHLKVAYLYLLRLPLPAAIDAMRAGVKAFNAAHKVPEAVDMGYHETMTCAWMHLVHVTLCQYGAGDTADAFLDQHPELMEKRALRLFYSRDRILTPEAKARFVTPDLAPLPVSSKPGPMGDAA